MLRSLFSPVARGGASPAHEPKEPDEDATKRCTQAAPAQERMPRILIIMARSCDKAGDASGAQVIPFPRMGRKSKTKGGQAIEE